MLDTPTRRDTPSGLGLTWRSGKDWGSSSICWRMNLDACQPAHFLTRVNSWSLQPTVSGMRLLRVVCLAFTSHPTFSPWWRPAFWALPRAHGFMRKLQALPQLGEARSECSHGRGGVQGPFGERKRTLSRFHHDFLWKHQYEAAQAEVLPNICSQVPRLITQRHWVARTLRLAGEDVHIRRDGKSRTWEAPGHHKVHCLPTHT